MSCIATQHSLHLSLRAAQVLPVPWVAKLLAAKNFDSRAWDDVAAPVLKVARLFCEATRPLATLGALNNEQASQADHEPAVYAHRPPRFEVRSPLFSRKYCTILLKPNEPS